MTRLRLLCQAFCSCLASSVLFVSLFGNGAADTQLPPQEQFAITDITLIDVAAGRALANQTVVVSEGRIASIGQRGRIRVPAAARRIDGRGKFLIPGLIDTHIHLATSADRDRLRAVVPLIVHGVTGVRDAGASGQDEWLVTLRRRVANGDVLAPRMYVSGMLSRRSIERSGLGDAAALARRQLDLGVDGLKIRDGLTREDIRAILEVASTANRPVYGHTYDTVSREREQIYTLDAVRNGVSGTMHVMGMPQLGSGERPTPPPGPRFEAAWQTWWVYYASLWRHADPNAERELIETMVFRNAWLEPTLITEDWIVNAATYREGWRERGLPGSFERAHEGFPAVTGVSLQQYGEAVTRMKDFIRRFHKAGGVITAGTDCLPVCGFGLHDELELLVSAGLSPAAALRAATLDAARVLRWDASVGRIAPNLIADLVLLDGNPLQDIRQVRRVRAVVTNGRYLDRDRLDGLLANALASGD